MRGEGRKRPWLAVVLSLFFPGLGQLYNGQIAKAIPIIALVIIVRYLSREPLKIFLEAAETQTLEDLPRSTLTLAAGYLIATLLIVGISVYDANVTARKINLDLEKKET